LRDQAGRIMQTERVASCGHKLVGPQATICVGRQGGYVAGVETCGSVWMCPVCAAKIAEGRRDEVARCLDAHVGGGGNVYMALFTIPHKAAESVGELRGDVTKAWSKFIAGNPWKRARERYGIVGYIRALEITHGGNGWHPHLHTLFLTRKLTDDEAAGLRVWIGERWASVIERMTGKEVNLAVGFGFKEACSASAAGDYVAKWGVDSEIAKAGRKVSRKGGRSPWQLLADARDGDVRARWLFKDYAAAMKGARHLTWSVGLRDLYLDEPELSDEELARMDEPNNGDAQIIVFRKMVWWRLVRAAVVADVLTAAEEGGRAGVLAFLRERNLILPAGLLGKGSVTTRHKDFSHG
jgi:hypothetical protein